jgi:hypothetical protein
LAFAERRHFRFVQSGNLETTPLLSANHTANSATIEAESSFVGRPFLAAAAFPGGLFEERRRYLISMISFSLVFTAESIFCM